MINRRVLFLPDFGTEIGGGHVMRCLTLAAELSGRGASCGFAVLPAAKAVIRTFAGDSVQIVHRAWAAPVAVVDGYDYTAEDERNLAAEGRKVVAIDDIVRVHDCDLVIDNEPGRTAQDYPGRARVLAGPAYALIRPEFLVTREAALSRRAGPGRGRVLVSLGLTDVGAITERVLRLMLDLDGWGHADVVLGENAMSRPFVEALAARDSRVVLHVNTKAMAALIADADFAVGAGGGSLFERAVLGLPTATIVLADNQAHAAKMLAQAGATLSLDARDAAFDADFRDTFVQMAANEGLRRALATRSAKLCDGLGVERVADAILALVAGGESARPSV